MNNTQVELVKFNDDLLAEIWKQGFSEEKPEWKNWDGPYFENDYHSYDSFDQFIQSEKYSFFMDDQRRCILFNGDPVGMVGRYWKDENTRWLEIGITIYNPRFWSGGIGSLALKLWISEIFNHLSELEHIGLTTWSGNQRMMRVAEKLGMKKEAHVRKVRFWKNHYFDSLSYGILREEWKAVLLKDSEIMPRETEITDLN